jgi:oligoribonuclease NrnB/cAMP/cGMP phosphodiesterase (DHH superfamily)
MKVLYHIDADGHCSGFWVAKRFNDYNKEDFIEIDYGTDIDWFSKIKKDEKVVIVDFSLEPEDMRRLYKKTKDIIWIDHHITAINKYKDFDIDIPGLRYDGIAASVLTYCYFFKMKDGKIDFDPNTMPQSAPWFTKYIGDYDVWKYEFGDETSHFILGLDCIEDQQPYDHIWTNLLDDIFYTRKLINDGVICEKYRNSIASKIRKQASFEWKFNNYKALCLNNTSGNSTYFGDEIKNYDLVCLFNYNGKIWEYSFYTEKDNVDVSEIALSYNKYESTLSAGGHKKAAGLQSTNFIFK